MEKIIRMAMSIVFAVVAPVALLAHPGHGHENPLNPGHYVANPEHFLPLALTIVAVLVTVIAYRGYRDYLKQNR